MPNWRTHNKTGAVLLSNFVARLKASICFKQTNNTTSKNKTVYSCFKWPHSKAGWNLCHQPPPECIPLPPRSLFKNSVSFAFLLLSNAINRAKNTYFSDSLSSKAFMALDGYMNWWKNEKRELESQLLCGHDCQIVGFEKFVGYKLDTNCCMPQGIILNEVVFIEITLIDTENVCPDIIVA